MSNNKNSLQIVLKSGGQLRLLSLSVLVGGLAGLTAVLYRLTLSRAEQLQRMTFSIAFNPIGIAALFMFLLALGWLAGLFIKSEPLIKGSGIPQVEGQLLGYFSPKALAVLLKKFIGGAVCILGGLSLGREGPSIQLGAMSAQALGEGLGSSRVEQKYMIICGACAGLAAAFNAPLAGLMFALEEIHKNFSPRAMFSAMIAAITADVVSKMFYGIAPTLNLPAVSTLALLHYQYYIAFGVVMGVFGAFYNFVLIGLQKCYARLPIPSWSYVMVPFAAAGLVGLLMPQALGGGHGIIMSLGAGEMTLRFMVVLLAVKFAFSMISFCSGAPGGIFFPLLVLGSLAGTVFAGLCSLKLGLPASYSLNFMLLGMAGMFAAVVRAPLTGIILIVEMSGSLSQFIGLAIVACVAALTANVLRSRPIYEHLLDNMTPDSLEKAAGGADQNLIDIAVPLHSPLAGKAISEIDWPASSLIVSIVRGSSQIIPHGDTVIESGDLLTVVCLAGYEDQVQRAAGSAS